MELFGAKKDTSIPALYFGAKAISVKWNNGLIVVTECRILNQGIFLCYSIIIIPITYFHLNSETYAPPFCHPDDVVGEGSADG
jgi:hypothetical protein